MTVVVPVLLLVNAGLALALVAVSLTRRRVPGQRSFATLMGAVALWSVANATHIVADDPNVKRALGQVAYPFIVASIVSWWRCCATYAGRPHLASGWRLVAVALPGLVSLALVAAGPRTTLMWTDLNVTAGPGPVSFPPGSWFAVHSAWAFSVGLGGLLLVARAVLRAPRTYRPQLVVFLIAVAAPLAVNAGTIQTGLVDGGGYDWTPVAMLISGVAFGVGLLRLGLLDLVVGVVPAAYDAVISSMRDGVLVVDTDGRVLGANAASGTVLGRREPPAVGSPVTSALATWAPGTTFEHLVGTGGEARFIEVSSSTIGQHRGHVVTLRDVTSARLAEQALRASLERASHQALHDHLTDLPNRRRLFDALRAQTDRYALVIIDLDGFKAVNDSYGHGAGDEVLLQVARRLRAASRPEAVVARLGGDEFAVLLPGATVRQAELAARLAVEYLAAPVSVEGQEVTLTASAGIAASPQHGTAIDEIVRAADVAMYGAKRSRQRVATYGSLDDARAPTRVLLLRELRAALAADELLCYYQPQARPDGSIRGAEALVRWQHPTRGLLRPSAFLKAVVDGGLVRQLSDRVLDIAARDVASWHRGGHDWTVSVNLDAEDLSDPTLDARIGMALGRHGVSPRWLTIEITESAAFDSSTGAGALARLRQLGVSVALDDFGTGYGPLAHLRELPIDELKLDRSFTSGLIRDRRSAALVAGQIRLGHDLGLSVVAEGVESAACAERLLELQCDVLQGFHIALPVASADMAAATAQLT